MSDAELIGQCDSIARLMDGGAIHAENAAPFIGELVARFTAKTDAPAGVTVTLPFDVWGHVLNALDAYQNDPDAREEYPEDAAALDAAGSAITAARIKFAKGAN